MAHLLRVGSAAPLPPGHDARERRPPRARVRPGLLRRPPGVAAPVRPDRMAPAGRGGVPLRGRVRGAVVDPAGQRQPAVAGPARRGGVVDGPRVGPGHVADRRLHVGRPRLHAARQPVPAAAGVGHGRLGGRLRDRARRRPDPRGRVRERPAMGERSGARGGRGGRPRAGAHPPSPGCRPGRRRRRRPGQRPEGPGLRSPPARRHRRGERDLAPSNPCGGCSGPRGLAGELARRGSAPQSATPGPDRRRGANGWRPHAGRRGAVGRWPPVQHHLRVRARRQDRGRLRQGAPRSVRRVRPVHACVPLDRGVAAGERRLHTGVAHPGLPYRRHDGRGGPSFAREVGPVCSGRSWRRERGS